METKKKYNGKTTKMPERTVFSINPETGLPFCTVEVATLIISKHIRVKATNLLKKYSFDDIKQELLLKLCISNYDPKLSSPRTFIIMVSITACCKLNNALKIRNKHMEINDFIIGEDGQSAVETWQIPETINPENYLLTNELITEFYKNPIGKNGKRRVNPEGYSGAKTDPKVNKGRIKSAT